MVAIGNADSVTTEAVARVRADGGHLIRSVAVAAGLHSYDIVSRSPDLQRECPNFTARLK